MWMHTVQYLVLLIQPSWVLPQASATKWERFGDSMYSFKLDIAREMDTTHVDASFQCQSVGGWLVSIESTAEQEFIQTKIKEKVEGQGQTFAREQWWTSGHWNKKDEKWAWHNGIEVQSSQKLPKEENNEESSTPENANYIALVHDVGTWEISPLPANYRLRFICEKEAEPAFIMDRFNRPAEERILRSVLQDYDNDARGNRKAEATVTVSVQFVLLRIQDLEEKNMVLTTMGFIIAEWLDERLSWHPEHYDNVTSVVLRAERIWLPELAIVNGAEETIISNFEKQRAVINYDGKVHWEPGGNFRTTCDVDIWYFPFDQQECSIVIGAWIYNSNKMNVTNISSKMTTDNFTVNGEWELLDTSARWGEVGLPCCPDIKYSHVVFTLKLERRCLFYLVNIVTPCILLSLLSLAVFWVPTEEGEKVSSGISVFLAFTVFLLMLADNIPKTSLHVPIFVIYLSCTMTLIGISITWTVIILNIHYHIKDTPVPRWAQRLILRRKKHMCCPLEIKNKSDTKFVFKPAFPPKETHPNGLLKRRPPSGAGAQTDFYLTHQTEIDPPPPPPPALETDTVVRIKGTNETYTAHASDDTCGLSSSLIGGDEGSQSMYVPETTDNAEDWKQLARKLDKIVFAIILTLMVFSAVFILLMPFYNKYAPSENH